MTANEVVSAAIEHELERQGLQRQQLAARMGYAPSWVTRKLKGDRRWSVDDLDEVSRVLGVPVAALLMAPREALSATHRYLRRVWITVRYPTRLWHFSPISA